MEVDFTGRTTTRRIRYCDFACSVTRQISETLITVLEAKQVG